MARARVSPKYQIVIPKDVRSRADVKPGEYFEVLTKGGVIMLVPDRPLSQGRGLLKGIRTRGFRERKDRV